MGRVGLRAWKPDPSIALAMLGLALAIEVPKNRFSKMSVSPWRRARFGTKCVRHHRASGGFHFVQRRVGGRGGGPAEGAGGSGGSHDDMGISFFPAAKTTIISETSEDFIEKQRL